MEILKPYEKPKQRTINQKEYRTALRGESKKLKLMSAIDYAVANSRSKQQFIKQMEKLGYGVKWIDHYKYITYTTPEGQRFRDNRLLEDKYLKTNMEELFAYGYDQTKEQQFNTENHPGNSGCTDGADTAPVPAAKPGTVQQDSRILQCSWEQHCRDHGFDIVSGDISGSGGRAEGDDPSCTQQNAGYGSRQSGLDEVFRRGQIIEADGLLDQADRYENRPDDGGTESQGSDTVEDLAEMGINWSDIAADGLYLAADLAMIAQEDEDDEKREYIVERKNRPKEKGRTHENGGPGFGMSM